MLVCVPPVAFKIGRVSNSFSTTIHRRSFRARDLSASPRFPAQEPMIDPSLSSPSARVASRREVAEGGSAAGCVSSRLRDDVGLYETELILSSVGRVLSSFTSQHHLREPLIMLRIHGLYWLWPIAACVIWTATLVSPPAVDDALQLAHLRLLVQLGLLLWWIIDDNHKTYMIDEATVRELPRSTAIRPRLSYRLARRSSSSRTSEQLSELSPQALLK